MIALRRQGLSSYEISARLAAEGTPLNRTGVAEILTEEGFGRLLRHPQPAASINPATPGRDTALPRTEQTRLGRLAGPGRDRQGRAAAADRRTWSPSTCPPWSAAAGYPGTRVVPATCWLASLLALKLTRTRRVSHVDDLLLADPAAALFAGLATLPKKSALTDYSYRTTPRPPAPLPGRPGPAR